MTDTSDQGPRSLPGGSDLAHAVRLMRGRDSAQPGRGSSPLELLFDLTFVVAVGQAAGLFAYGVATGHVRLGLVAFAFATFAVCGAWVNFSWFASAFDTDDWVFRVVTMVQMVGVCILALGVPALFSSIEAGEHVDNRVMVLGYVVMRLAMVFQWLLAARQSPQHRHACLTYAKAIADGLVAHHRDEGREHEREQADRHRDARPGQEHEH